jgi:hypothetical protein
MRLLTRQIVVVLITALTSGAQCWSKCFGERCLELIVQLQQRGGPPAAPPCHSKQQEEPARPSESCDFAHFAEERVPAAKADFTALFPVFIVPSVEALRRTQIDAGVLYRARQSFLPPLHLIFSTVIRT